jgi:hypothetical protein
MQVVQSSLLIAQIRIKVKTNRQASVVKTHFQSGILESALHSTSSIGQATDILVEHQG